MTNPTKILEKRKELMQEIITKNIDRGPEKCVAALIEGIEEDMKKSRRTPPEPPPEGGINIRAASHKYEINNETLRKWVVAGFITILRKDRNWTWLKEADIIPLAKVYKNNHGSGRREVVKKAREIKNSGQ